ncbi:MAG: zf-HC2 domain-containing protein [Gemmatimonadota bacterium]|jgi:hypothetical protein
MDRVDCQVFEDQLDAWLRGELGEEGEAQLRAHAAACPTCDAMARVGGHLAAPSLEELEARVPDAWVASMASDVRRALRDRRAGGRRRSGWAVPALAAAVLALLLFNGMTLRTLARASEREQALQSQVLEQQRRLTEVGGGEERGGRGGVAGFGRSASLRSLEGRAEVTVAELRALLADLPPATTVLRAWQTEALAGSRRMPPAWRAALERLDTGGDVTAGEVLGVLDDLELPGAATVPASRLLELLS